ncbi:AraC family transcriptional regulator ligand-binding domain-containing protein [Streptomyces sp. NPDC094032]|uniref:AraC family transcriptional regulator ligand-binding domain-containing protein n=1 Tax=Streptomyces sp. NPDC094032 TaxID=3155308 RepID=UPI003317F0F2
MSVHAHPGTTPAAFTRLNVRSAALLGVPKDRYAGLLGLDPEHLGGDRYRTPAATNVRMWELMVTKAPWPEVGLVMAEQSDFGQLGVWDYLFTSAPTPLEGLQDATDYLAGLGDVGTDSMFVVQDDEEVTLSHVNAADLSYDVASAIRAYALGLVRLRLSTALRKDVVPVRVALATRPPARHGALHELYGTRDIEFEHPVSSITFRAADLRARAPQGQPGLSAVLRSHAELTLAAAIPLHSWLDLFRVALKHAADDGRATLPATAARLAVSPRTLQRRLDEHGTSWTAELEAVRRAEITRLLGTTDLPVDTIAERTGYADARTLRRAVLRWTGHTPTALRGHDGPATR